MKKAKVGLVGVTCQFESGGQRADELLRAAKAAIEAKSVEVALAPKVVWDSADAVDVADALKKEQIDALVIMDITWVLDSMKYVLVHELDVPVVFWGVPYTETFSIGCIQHFGSVLKAHGHEYEYVYGLPEDPQVVDHVAEVATAGRVIHAVSGMRLALAGPRQTWRVAGPQDMTNEEWEFSEKFGLTILHVEMSEIIGLADAISDKKADETLEELAPRTGKTLADKETMRHMAKVYLAVKQVKKRYSLDAMAAECYPDFSGLMNLPSSWLADEGFIVDTEGDIGHAAIMYMLNTAAGGGACALGEIGSIDAERNIFALAHEGSTAHSLAEDIDHVQISPSGDRGAFVGLPLRPMQDTTVMSIVGSRGKYQVLLQKGDVCQATHQEWVDGGEKLLALLHVEPKVYDFLNAVMAHGLDHHMVIKEGNYRKVMTLVIKYMHLAQLTVEA